MNKTSLPLGVRFHPTNVELTQYYLKRKVMGKQFCTEVIADVDIYKFAPWELPAKSCWISKDLEWYFFCPREMKHANGSKINRNTEYGFWKTSGKDRPILYKEKKVGMIKTLIFHSSRPPNEGRTNWVMHEYRLEDQDLTNAGVDQGACVICKIFEKSGPGPMNGAQYGAPFDEEEWSVDEQVDGEESVSLAGISTAASVLQNIQESSVTTNTFIPGTTCIGSSSLSTSFKLVQPTENFLRPINDDDVDMRETPSIHDNDLLSMLDCVSRYLCETPNENMENEGLLPNLDDGIDNHNGYACEGGLYMELDDLQWEVLFDKYEPGLSPTCTFDDVEHALAIYQNSTLPEESNEFHNQLNVIRKNSDRDN